MLAILFVRRVVRLAGKAGKVTIKPVDMVTVSANQGFDAYGLNLHACGKIEFFRNAQYAMIGSPEYTEMLAVAKAHK